MHDVKTYRRYLEFWSPFKNVEDTYVLVDMARHQAREASEINAVASADVLHYQSLLFFMYDKILTQLLPVRVDAVSR